MRRADRIRVNELERALLRTHLRMITNRRGTIVRTLVLEPLPAPDVPRGEPIMQQLPGPDWGVRIVWDSRTSTVSLNALAEAIKKLAEESEREDVSSLTQFEL